MGSDNPDDHQRVAAADEKNKRKRVESDGKYRANQKESKEAQSLKTVQNECSRLKAQLESYEKSVMKPLLDEAWKIRKPILELGESSGHARETVEKQRDLVDSACWELLKMPLGSTSASTDKDAYPPLEVTVAAMKADGSVMTESFEKCRSLPEEWTPLAFDKLFELYFASVAQHAQETVTLLKLHAKAMAAAAAQHAHEKFKLLKLHAQGMAAAEKQHKQELKLHAQGMAAAAAQHKQEMAAAAARHAQEMAAAAARHAQEMAAVKREYSLKYLGNLDQMCDDMDCDQPGYSGDTHM